MGKGVVVVSGVGLGIFGGVKVVGKGIDNELERFGGFIVIN